MGSRSSSSSSSSGWERSSVTLVAVLGAFEVVVVVEVVGLGDCFGCFSLFLVVWGRGFLTD